MASSAFSLLNMPGLRRPRVRAWLVAMLLAMSMSMSLWRPADSNSSLWRPADSNSRGGWVASAADATAQAIATNPTTTTTTTAATRREFFNDSSLGSLPRFTEPPSLFELHKREIFEMLEWGCLYGTNQPHHSENKWADMDYNRSEALEDWQFMQGTTIWINEHMAVGHMMYDVFIIQVE